MHKVYCRGRKNSKWKEYSSEYQNFEDAEKCKQKAENRQSCDIYGNLIRYKIVTIT